MKLEKRVPRPYNDCPVPAERIDLDDDLKKARGSCASDEVQEPDSRDSPESRPYYYTAVPEDENPNAAGIPEASNRNSRPYSHFNASRESFRDPKAPPLPSFRSERGGVPDADSARVGPGDHAQTPAHPASETSSNVQRPSAEFPAAQDKLLVYINRWNTLAPEERNVPFPCETHLPDITIVKAEEAVSSFPQILKERLQVLQIQDFFVAGMGVTRRLQSDEEYGDMPTMAAKKLRIELTGPSVK